MHLKRLLLILLLCFLSLKVQAATVTDNSGDLIGTWDIIDSNNNNDVDLSREAHYTLSGKV